MFTISSCASQDSSAILSSNMDLPSSVASSSSSLSSTFVAGGRALDRHNPIITDEKRSGINSRNGTPIGTPCTNHVLQQKPKTPLPPSPIKPSSPINSPNITRKKKSNNNRSSFLRMTKNNNKKNTKKNNVVTKPTSLLDNNHDTIDNDNYEQGGGRKSFSKASDLIMKGSACNTSRPVVDYISPPESSRYLLDDTSFLDVLSDFNPLLKLAPYNSNHPEVVSETNADHDSNPPKSSSTSDQVVVLRVSLHCRGCERKMKKHLSRMAGVTSFNIDFAAKKVTVVGDVTPLGVLASISKVKTAKLWAAPTVASSSHINTRNIEYGR